MGYLRKQEDNRRLKFIHDNGGNGYCKGVNFYNGHYMRVYPYSANHNKKKDYCKICNRLVRRMEIDIVLNRCQYKKMFDLWWSLY